MSDARLRELERRWRETGAVDDEAACLAERVRVGVLAPENLRLAAYCGHPAARAAAPEAPSAPLLAPADFIKWFDALEEAFGERVTRRALIYLGLECCREWARALPDDALAREAADRFKELSIAADSDADRSAKATEEMLNLARAINEPDPVQSLVAPLPSIALLWGQTGTTRWKRVYGRMFDGLKPLLVATPELFARVSSGVASSLTAWALGYFPGP